MHHTQIKSAVAKYKGFRTVVSKAELEKIVSADDKEYSSDEVAEILAALEKEPLTPVVDAALKNVESQLKWYDEFQARIEKKLVTNVLMGKQESIIVGWELVKKLMPKFIEPSVAKHLNSFADGFAGDQPGLFLYPKGEAKTGDVIPYKVWADEMGRNAAQDINQLLNQ
jgi:hypothetical protein